MASTLLALLAILPLIAATPLRAGLAARSRPAYNTANPKRGLPYNDPTTNIQDWSGYKQIQWAYNWDSQTDANFPFSTLEYYPMLWGNTSDHTTQWKTNAQNYINKGSNHLLFYNEPDNCGGGACVSATQAAADFVTYMNPFYSQAFLGGPAVEGNAAGLAWLQAFVNECEVLGCNIDFFPVHWYDSATNFAWLELFLSEAHAIAGTKNIVLSEFEGSGTLAQQEAFLAQALPYLDSTAWVSQYSWFWAGDAGTSGSLVNSNGTPSPLGVVYGSTAH